MAPLTKTRLCRKCASPIPPSVVIDGKRRMLWIRKYCLDCSPWGSRNNKKLEFVRLDGLKSCSECGAEWPAEDFKRNGICKDCLAKNARLSRTLMKRRCVDFLGGKCIKCGYHRCLAALDFHHRDPKEKDFEIGRSRWRDFGELKPELLKCDLLCRNCHAEVHAQAEAALIELDAPLANAEG